MIYGKSMTKNQKSLNRKVIINNSFRVLTIIFSLLLVAILMTMFIFIFIQANGDISIIDILFKSNSIDPNNNEFSFWLPFSVTVITSVLALLIAAPIGIKTAIFIKFRVHKKHQKKVRIFFDVLAGIPSVVFGLFAISSLGPAFESIFGISPFSIFNSIIMLAFMIAPTVISLTINNLDNISSDLIVNPMAMGSTRTRSIYKIFLKAARPGIIVACVLAFTRAISESIALSMLLSATPNSNMFSGGLEFFTSNFQTIGAFLATMMFSETNIELIRPALFAFGLILFIISIFINGILVMIQRKKKSRFIWFLKVERAIYHVVWMLPNFCVVLFEKITYRSKKGYKVKHDNIDQSILYAKERIENNNLKNTYSYYKIALEWISFLICVSFVIWISGDIIINGAIASTATNTILEYGRNDIGQSFINTILVVLTSILISMPISLMVALYLNEYAKKGFFKDSILFFSDAIGTTPSILFGMFGLIFFIETLGISAGGTTGNSLIAGSLTLSIVVIPTFVRLLQQALFNVPMELRINSIALGNTKFSTIRRLVLPAATSGIITALVLTVGRILSETAPLYLTAGLSSSKEIALDRPGMTLTTHIYAQIFSIDTELARSNIQYQASLLIFVLIFSLVFIGYIIIPKWKKIKQTIANFLRDHFANVLNLVNYQKGK